MASIHGGTQDLFPGREKRFKKQVIHVLNGGVISGALLGLQHTWYFPALQEKQGRRYRASCHCGLTYMWLRDTRHSSNTENTDMCHLVVKNTPALVHTLNTLDPALERLQTEGPSHKKVQTCKQLNINVA